MTVPITTDEFRALVRAGRTSFAQFDLSAINWSVLHFQIGPRHIHRRRWSDLSFGQTTEEGDNAFALRHRIADLIENQPKLHDQGSFGVVFNGIADGQSLSVAAPECGTACCVAGWAARFTVPGRLVRSSDTDIVNVAFRALWLDRKPMPNFRIAASRKGILRDLRA